MIEIIALALLSLIVNIIVIITGFGTSTLMIPILIFFMPTLTAIFFVSIIELIGNIWKYLFFHNQVNWSIASIFSFTGVISAILGTFLAFKIQDILLYRLIGVNILAYVLFLYFNPVFHLKNTTIPAVIGGLLYGFSAGLTGIGGPFRGIALLSYELPKAAYIATHGVIAGFTGISRISTYIIYGHQLTPLLWKAVLISIPFIYIGAKIGQLISNKISEEIFRKIVLIF